VVADSAPCKRLAGFRLLAFRREPDRPDERVALQPERRSVLLLDRIEPLTQLDDDLFPPAYGDTYSCRERNGVAVASGVTHARWHMRTIDLLASAGKADREVAVRDRQADAVRDRRYSSLLLA
jgi:hypothetical protein